MSEPAIENRDNRRRGSLIVLSAVLLVFVVGMAAFTTDIGFVTISKAQVRSAADAAALASIVEFENGEAAALQAVTDLLLLNGYDVATNTDLALTTEFGTWNPDTYAFNVTATFDEADAVRVELTDNGVTAFFGGIFSQSGYSVTGEAIAVRSSSVPRDIVMVVDCSTSMDANMSNGLNRIENAKDAGQALIDELQDEDRVALGVFSWKDPARKKWKKVEKTGRKETDLNFDHDPTYNRVEDLDEGFYTSGTNIAGGLRAGLDVFLDDPNPRPPPQPEDPEVEQILVLLTDGQTNKAEPYPLPDDGPTGVLPPPPYKKKYDKRIAVTKWANTIKARGIKIHVVTLGTGAHDPLMVSAASPDEGETTYYHHIATGSGDSSGLLGVYKKIGMGNTGPKLVK